MNVGDKGIKGELGEKGVKGFMGPQGIVGEQGIQGPIGNQVKYLNKNPLFIFMQLLMLTLCFVGS